MNYPTPRCLLHIRRRGPLWIRRISIGSWAYLIAGNGRAGWVIYGFNQFWECKYEPADLDFNQFPKYLFSDSSDQMKVYPGANFTFNPNSFVAYLYIIILLIKIMAHYKIPRVSFLRYLICLIFLTLSHWLRISLRAAAETWELEITKWKLKFGLWPDWSLW